MRKILIPLLISVGIVISGCDKKKMIIGDSIFDDHDSIGTNRELQKVNVFVDDRTNIETWPAGDYYSELGSVNIEFGGKYKIIKSIKVSKQNTDFNHITMPVIIDNQMFTLDSAGILYKVDIKNNYRNIWKIDIKKLLDGNEDSFVYGGLSYGNDRLFIGTNNGYVMSFNAKDGNLLWKHDLKVPFWSPFKYRNSRIYGLSSTESTIALDVSSGSTIWKHDGLQTKLMTIQHPSVMILDDVIVSSHSTGDVFGLDINTGTPLWINNMSSANRQSSGFILSDIDANPAIVAKDIIAVGTISGGMSIINAKNGMTAWQKQYSVNSQIAVSGHFIFFIDDSSHLICMHAPTGEIKWIQNLRHIIDISVPRYINDGNPELNIPINRLGPMIVDDQLLVVSPFGHISLFHVNDGSLAKKIEIPYFIRTNPVIVNHKMYLVNDADGIIYVLE